MFPEIRVCGEDVCPMSNYIALQEEHEQTKADLAKCVKLLTAQVELVAVQAERINNQEVRIDKQEKETAKISARVSKEDDEETPPLCCKVAREILYTFTWTITQTIGMVRNVTLIQK